MLNATLALGGMSAMSGGIPAETHTIAHEQTRRRRRQAGHGGPSSGAWRTRGRAAIDVCNARTRDGKSRDDESRGNNRRFSHVGEVQTIYQEMGTKTELFLVSVNDRPSRRETEIGLHSSVRVAPSHALQ